MASIELAAPWSFDAGQRLGRAEISAAGAMSAVYRTELHGVDVAIKVAPSSSEALFNEATILARAVSPRLPRLRGVGWLDQEQGDLVASTRGGAARPFLVIDWVTHAEKRPDDRGSTALAIARDVGAALADLHALGIAHGDVKPGNLVLSPDGRVTLIDLGLGCSIHDLLPKGGTPRYLATSDGDLGDARARDVLALAAVIAEELDPEVRASARPIDAARAATFAGRLGEWLGAMLVRAPGARPSSRWLADLASDLAGGITPEETSESRAAQVRAAYLRARLTVPTRTRGDAPEWLGHAIEWKTTLDHWRGDATRQLDTGEAAALGTEGVARWLAALVGAAAASWPVAAIAGENEAHIAASLTELARIKAPAGWTFFEVERAVLRDEWHQAANTGRSDPVERAASIAIGLTEVPPRFEAIEAVEKDPHAGAILSLSAARALRGLGEPARARTLALRAMNQGGAAQGRNVGVVAEILRRCGDVEGASSWARRAVHDDLDGSAHAVLGRIAFDQRDYQGALDEVRLAPGAGAAEVAALAHAGRGELGEALGAIARGLGHARTPEERARLAGARGYILTGIDSGEALSAYREAVEHAVQAGLTIEEATYRTGEAASAVDEGHFEVAISTSRRAALLWEALDRPALAARANLASAAAYAILGGPEARTYAERASELAELGSDRRGELYAWLSAADAETDRSDAALEATARAKSALERMVDPPTEDRLRLSARELLHGAVVDVATFDGWADSSVAARSGARLEWWCARAKVLLRSSASTLQGEAARDGDKVLAAIAGLVGVVGPVGFRGRAFYAGVALAGRCGRSDVADRLRSALRETCRTLLSRVGSDLVERARSIDWVEGGESNSGPLAMEAEQVRDLETLVRALGSGERLGALLRRVLDALILWTGVERGLLLLRAPDGRLVPRAARNFARADLRGPQALLSQSLAHRALDALEPVVAVDAAGDLPDDLHASVQALRLRSVLAVPLVARGQAIGVAYLDDRVRRGAFGPRELAWVRTIATLASSMIADARDQVLLRRAVRSAKRANERLAESLAEREARLDAKERDLERAALARGDRRKHPEIVGESEPIVRMLKILDRVASSDVPVLVTGESGSGKELVARAIHRGSHRATKPFVSENCGAIPEGLLESALFGHVKGAFTGADRPRVGLFEAADGGTLFLDEIGEMSAGMQAKLLRVLEERLVRPLGTERTRPVDVRVIAATHRDLEAMVRERRFREDLYYRLAIIGLKVPPLRERPSDVPLLVRRFIEKHGGGAHVSISRAAVQRLASFDWPGNVRQLENEVRRAMVLSDGQIEREHLSPEVDGAHAGTVSEAGLNVRKRIDHLESALVREALETTHGNQTKAARLLGLSRFGLQKMMKRLEIALP